MTVSTGGKGARKGAAAGGMHARARKAPLWYFAEENDGSFVAPDADYISGLYFPLMNHAGMKCSVTPDLKGDICSDFHAFHSIPTVTEDLHRINTSRNFWIYVKGKEPWSVTGVCAASLAGKWRFREGSHVHAGPGWFTITRRCPWLPVEATTTVFVPSSDEQVEVCIVTLRVCGKKTLRISPTYATPVFARSADNIRDHRQVTTMFNEIAQRSDGVVVTPRIIHDESGHRPNTTRYFVTGYTQHGRPPRYIWSSLRDFAGEGGSLDNPEAVYTNATPPACSDAPAQGVEAVGALRFSPVTLAPGKEKQFICIHGICDSPRKITQWSTKFNTARKATDALHATASYWQRATDAVRVHTGDRQRDCLWRWISFQPFCRKIYGNSYLPDYGYGRGGRGWRDLWQDLLTLFLLDPARTREDMLNNFLGVRIDGTNATIIGTRPGVFIADRNNIVRTWCDHGAWPFLVLSFYIHQSGDYDILCKEVSYFKDKFGFRNTRIDRDWDPDTYGTQQKDAEGNEYYGSILEHVVLMQLSALFHVGPHNNLLLEGGDWNDTYDMAREKGESVAFYAFYAWNCRQLSDILRHMHDRGVVTVSLLEEMVQLLDRLPGGKPLDYDVAAQKRERLHSFFSCVLHTVSGRKKEIDTRALADDLTQKADWVYRHIREKEWLPMGKDGGFFNGHYDDHAQQVDGRHAKRVRMDLTAQVFPVMGGVADAERVAQIHRSCMQYLYNEPTGGLRLCTDFKQLKLDFGRVTGFVYGVKEHGSIWNQMNAMYMYALYTQGFVKEAYRVYADMMHLCLDSARAKVFPNLPSYFTIDGKGEYNYLTGAATWFIMTVVTQMYGVRGYYGDLCLHPKITRAQFDTDGNISVTANFAGRRFTVIYCNPGKKEYGQYGIDRITLNGTDIVYSLAKDNTYAVIERELLRRRAKKTRENVLSVHVR